MSENNPCPQKIRLRQRPQKRDNCIATRASRRLYSALGVLIIKRFLGCNLLFLIRIAALQYRSHFMILSHELKQSGFTGSLFIFCRYSSGKVLETLSLRHSFSHIAVVHGSQKFRSVCFFLWIPLNKSVFCSISEAMHRRLLSKALSSSKSHPTANPRKSV